MSMSMKRLGMMTVKERRMRMPKKRGWGRATTRQNLTRSSADWREDCTPDSEPETLNIAHYWFLATLVALDFNPCQ